MSKSVLLTRVAGRAIDLLLRLAAKIPPRVDLYQLLANRAEKLISLPGRLAFFPTATSDVSKIRSLLGRLHPVTSDRKLIRLGPDGDGGYLVPDDLEGVEACFSPGVSDVSGFERDCAELGMDVFMADASVACPAENHPAFHFVKKFIGATTEGDFITMEDWIESTLKIGSADLMLQMDIEGYEYEVILSMPSALLKRFRIVVVEFHFLDHLFSLPIFEIYSKAFERLLKTHTCVHIHPNNIGGLFQVGNLQIPQIAEFTFLRTDRIREKTFAKIFPHPLDRDNAKGQVIVLPSCCYRMSD